MKIVTINEIQNRIESKFPNQPFEIVEYTRVSKPFVIKCLKCGKIARYASFNNYYNSKRLGICSCYNQNNKFTQHNDNIKKVEDIINNDSDIEFIEYWYKVDTKKYMIRVKCLKCNQIYSKPIVEFIKNKSCPFCIGKELLNTQALKSILSNEYELLSQYKSTNDYIIVKHKCGFIWRTKAKKLYNYIGCPRCNKKRSKGEQKIEAYLISHNLDFEIEKSFSWQSNLKRRYDFYLPNFNLLIEYNGEQHYLQNAYFKVPVEEQKLIDQEKQEEALQHGFNYLVIGYFDFNNIETILNNWFNDYS